jgi:hypothetical protein
VADFLADASGAPVAGVSPPNRSTSFMQFARAAAGVRAPVSIAPSTPFIRVLELLGGRSPRIHRVYITEGGRPIGVVRRACACLEPFMTRADCAPVSLSLSVQITPTDVLRFLAVREEAF